MDSRRHLLPASDPFRPSLMTASDDDCDVYIDVQTTESEHDLLLSGNHPDRSLSPGSREDIRLRVNARERERMHDLNSAMDALRQVMPYAQGPSVKKISKMNTLLLARNYIVLLRRSIEEMKRFLADVCINNTPLPPMTSHLRSPSEESRTLPKISESLSLPHAPLCSSIVTSSHLVGHVPCPCVSCLSADRLNHRPIPGRAQLTAVTSLDHVPQKM